MLFFIDGIDIFLNFSSLEFPSFMVLLNCKYCLKILIKPPTLLCYWLYFRFNENILATLLVCLVISFHILFIFSALVIYLFYYHFVLKEYFLFLRFPPLVLGFLSFTFPLPYPKTNRPIAKTTYLCFRSKLPPRIIFESLHVAWSVPPVRKIYLTTIECTF